MEILQQAKGKSGSVQQYWMSNETLQFEMKCRVPTKLQGVVQIPKYMNLKVIKKGYIYIFSMTYMIKFSIKQFTITPKIYR